MIATIHPVSPEEVMALADGELSGAETSAVAAHMAECAECASVAAQLRDTSESLSRWTVPAAPSSMDEVISSAAAQVAGNAPSSAPVKTGRHPGRRQWKWNSWAIGPRGAVATIVVLLAIGSAIWLRSDMPFNRERIAASMAPPTGDSMSQPLSPPPPVPSESFAYEARQSDRLAAPAPGLADVSLAAPGSRAQMSKALEAKTAAGAPQLAPAPAPQFAPQIAPMIAHSVSLTVQVRDLGASRAALEALLARHRGYAAQLTVNTTEGSPRSLLSSLRVPDANLAAAIAEMRALGRVETENQSGEEVTQQHADLVARLQNSRETEQRLRELLAQHTGKIDDILQVEEEISRVRGEIEQMEAEQKVLEHRVDFATIELQLTEQYREQLGAQSASVPMQIRNAFVAGLRHAAATLLGILLFLEEAGPTVLIWLAILAVPGLLVWRRYRRQLHRQ
jgi:hypothetical protein